MTAARLAPELVAVPSAIATAAGAVVLVVGAITALRSGRPVSAFARQAGVALEFFLAAGVIRLAAVDSVRALMTVAAIVLVRQLIGRGIRAAAR